MPANKDTVRPWFKEGAYPNQAQFYQFFEWLRWKDEKISVADVEGLTDIVNGVPSLNTVKATYRDQLDANTATTYQVEAETIIHSIILKSETDAEISIGTAEGGNDVADAIPVLAGQPMCITTTYYKAAVSTLYFSGIYSNTTIIILKNSK